MGFINMEKRRKAYVQLLALLGIYASVLMTAQAQEELPRPLTEREVINNNIDVFAQRSIVRLSKGTLEERKMSRFLFKGVKYGALGGIYKVDTQVPVLRAQRLGKNWWTLLEGRPARCLTKPAGEKPIIIFGSKVASQPGALDVALVTAFHECGFRRVEVHVIKRTSRARTPCVEAFVTLSSDVNGGVMVSPPCYVTTQGVCNFAFPPAMYKFEVTCDGRTTSPPDIYRPVAPGEGIQTEKFFFDIPVYE